MLLGCVPECSDRLLRKQRGESAGSSSADDNRGAEDNKRRFRRLMLKREAGRETDRQKERISPRGKVSLHLR